jgi:hypothetical protein
MIKAAWNIWDSWVDEGIGRRGFWRSLPWFVLVFASALGVVFAPLIVLVGVICYFLGGWVAVAQATGITGVIYVMNVIGWSVLNAHKQMNLPADWEDFG